MRSRARSSLPQPRLRDGAGAAASPRVGPRRRSPWPPPSWSAAVAIGVPSARRTCRCRRSASALPGCPGIRPLDVTSVDVTIVWQVRLPRVVLGALVGAMLAGGGAAYQGVFRNPLADPYLLGIAAGGGLGATIGHHRRGEPGPAPRRRRSSARSARSRVTYLLGAGRRVGAIDGATASIVLAGVAVAALLTAVQTYLQQAHSGHTAGLHVDPRQPGARLLVRRGHGPAVCRSSAAAAARPPAAARCAARRRGRGRQSGREHRAAAPHRRRRRHARHRRGGRGQRADRLRRHHRPAHRAPDGRRQLPACSRSR